MTEQTEPAEQPMVNGVPYPPITDALREHARRNPGRWTYAVDPALEAGGEVPAEGIIGAWKVDENGEIDENFRPNDKYRPTPVARRWPEPTDQLDAVCQWAAAGWATPAQVTEMLLDSEFHALAPDEEDGFVMILGFDGNTEVHLFSDPAHAPEGEDIIRIGAAEVLEVIEPTGVLVVNPGSAGAYRLSADYLIDLAAERGQAGAQ